MKSFQKDTVANRAPHLRVYYGEETELPRNSAPLVADPPPHSLNEEVEAAWVGRTLAARISSRVAA